MLLLEAQSEDHTEWAQTPASTASGCLTLGELLNLSELKIAAVAVGLLGRFPVGAESLWHCFHFFPTTTDVMK